MTKFLPKQPLPTSAEPEVFLWLDMTSEPPCLKAKTADGREQNLLIIERQAGKAPPCVTIKRLFDKPLCEALGIAYGDSIDYQQELPPHGGQEA